MMRYALLALLPFVALSVADAHARPQVPAEQRQEPYSGQLPQCGDDKVLNRIQTRFRQAESEYWNSSQEISGFELISEIGWRNWGLDHIPRRYCKANATMKDGIKREVIYNIGEDLGMIGWGIGVEWCVMGFDRELAYAPHCRAAGP